MNKRIIIYYIIFIFACLIYSGCQSDNKYVKVQFGKQTFKVETAVTEAQRSKGLMHRRSLDADSGLLFVYSYEQQLSFWMKNTLIPLDIAFIARDGHILNIENMEPLDESTVVSDGKAMYALEMNRGFFEKYDIKVGDRIEFLTPLQYTLE
jgi:uncharacterized membrane protein (UPF0127 family)